MADVIATLAHSHTTPNNTPKPTTAEDVERVKQALAAAGGSTADDLRKKAAAIMAATGVSQQRLDNVMNKMEGGGCGC